MRTFPKPPRRVLTIGLAVAILASIVAGVTAAYEIDTRRTAVAYFASTTGLYEGNDVRILGVRVGEVESVVAEAERVRVKLRYDAEQVVPAHAKAVIVAPTLVSSRYLQLTPRYVGGPRLADGAVIPPERTFAPVQWDEVKRQLDTLTTALGPKGANKDGALSDAVRATARTLGGKGADINKAIEGLSRASRMLQDGSQDMFGTVRNLQVFVSALATSSKQVEEFSSRLADVSGLLAANRGELGKALGNLRTAVKEVAAFVGDNRAAVKGTVRNLTDVSTILADEQGELARLLHVAPTPMVNLYNALKPQTGSIIGQLVVTNFQSLSTFFCSGIAAVTDLKMDAVARTCGKQLSPLLDQLAMNYPPVQTNPVHRDGSTPVPASPGNAGEQGGSPGPERSSSGADADNSGPPDAGAPGGDGGSSGGLTGLGDLLLGGNR